MDIATFKDKLLNDELKSIKGSQKFLDCLSKKYEDIEVIGTYLLSDYHVAVYFKHKLWHKLAIFKGEDWIETRVNSLKNQLPEATMTPLLDNLGKSLAIIRIESVIPVDGVFYYYLIAKLSGKKVVLHVSREGEVLLKSKYIDYSIRLNDEEEEDDDNNEEEEEDEVNETMLEVSLEGEDLED